MKAWSRAVEHMVFGVEQMISDMRDLTAVERGWVEAELLKETCEPQLPEHVPLYDLVNAMTSAAKGAVPARRLELEAMAGDMLTLHVGRGA
jgi:hypothetical protein